MLGPAIYDEIDTFNAGDTAILLVSRGGTDVALPVKLDSLSDESVGNALSPDNYTVSSL